jgi:FAD/FMN-containing dehydrogenase
MTDITAALRGIVGERYVLDDLQSREKYGKDWTQGFKGDAKCVVLPASTKEVSAVLKACNEIGQPVVPSGGRTGLAAGAVATKDEVVLSLGRMNKILKVDVVGMAIQAEAGVRTQELQEAAANAGLFFPIDLAAKGSCHIGGNVATNAGGLKFIRFGGTREQTLGIEVVLADGTVLPMDGAVRKNNTGYDLKQLFIGSEGTLGIVTQATIRLTAKPRSVSLACMGVNHFQKVVQVLAEASKQGLVISAFEFFTQRCLDLVVNHRKCRRPFEGQHNFYVLLEIETGSDREAYEEFIGSMIEKDLAQDAILATSEGEFKEIWSYRESITESIAAYGWVHKNDIALAIGDLSAFYDILAEILGSEKRIEVVTFGHVGDGNLHLNYISPKTMAEPDFRKVAKEVEAKIFGGVRKFRGSISAEHGIGLLKKHELGISRTEIEIGLMRQLKKVFDPKGILNPGKIF